MKDQSFKRRFVAFAVSKAAILLRKTSPNSVRKDAFALAKAMVINMCGRYVTEDDTSIDMGALYHELNLSYPDIKLKSGEIFPTDTVPLLCGKDRIPVPATWGYPGFQNKGVIINVRSESVADKPSFRDAFINHRCIVPTNGYYEWSGSKVKYRFNLPDTQMVYLAGIYRHTPEGIRFVILTTDANESVLPIHHRMPVILTPDMLDVWTYSAREASNCLRVQAPMLINAKEA